jgi:hypothetical protein
MLLVLDRCEKCLLFANKAKDISRRKSCLWLFCYCHILKYNSLFYHVKEIFFEDSIEIYPFLLYIVMSALSKNNRESNRFDKKACSIIKITVKIQGCFI